MSGALEPTDADLAARAMRANRATRGALAGVLGLEAVVTLLVPRALAFSDGGLGVTRTVLLASLAVVMIVAAGLLRRSWGIGFATAMQLLFLLSGLWLLPLLIVAGIFCAVWVRLLMLRAELVHARRGWAIFWS